MYVHVYIHVGTQGKNAKFKVRKLEVGKSSSTKVRLNNTMMLAGRVKGRRMYSLFMLRRQRKYERKTVDVAA